MKHYEIVLIIHPDQSDQVSQMVDRYQKQVTSRGGHVHRFEDWGRRVLAYPINKIHKGHYVLLNLECDNETLTELSNAFRYNDAVVRNLILVRDEAITDTSIMLKSKEDEERSDHGDKRDFKPTHRPFDEDMDDDDEDDV
jgi:small subunit ribosomal protein S6